MLFLLETSAVPRPLVGGGSVVFTSGSDSCPNGVSGRAGNTGAFLCLAEHIVWTAAMHLPLHGQTCPSLVHWFFPCEH